MSSPNLATVEQLSAYMQVPLATDDVSATLMLEIASGMVRDYLHQDLTYHADDVVTLDPITGAYVFLPELPVADVTKVETFVDGAWVEMDASTYTVSIRQGAIAALPGTGVSWPKTPNSWRVTYSHGFAEIPNSLVGVCLGVAARAYNSPASVESERLGEYSVKYSIQAEGFTPLEKLALGRYLEPRIA